MVQHLRRVSGQPLLLSTESDSDSTTTETSHYLCICLQTSDSITATAFWTVLEFAYLRELQIVQMKKKIPTNHRNTLRRFALLPVESFQAVHDSVPEFPWDCASICIACESNASLTLTTSTSICCSRWTSFTKIVTLGCFRVLDMPVNHYGTSFHKIFVIFLFHFVNINLNSKHFFAIFHCIISAFVMASSNDGAI